MGIRVRPQEVEIPQDDPFRNDLLNRREPAEILTQLIDGIDGPCVLAVDAAWGAGKTTFLKMWAQHLRNERFPVVEFNAWETDHAGDPFVAIVTELTEGLRGIEDESLNAKIRNTAEAAKQVAVRAIPGVIRLFTAGVLDVEPLIEKEAGKILSSYAEDRLKTYTKAKDSIAEFGDRLQEMARSPVLSEHPLVVMIDELDRCRPSYAVELIEVAKHLFSVDHTVFVLAVNRDQLAHSIKALYGNEFDATGYLRRFFDADFQLPNPERRRYIETLLNATNVHGDTSGLLQVFFSCHSFSLRQIAQSISRLSLVASSLNRHRYSALSIGVAIILRAVDASLYDQFLRGLVSDEYVVDSIFETSSVSMMQREHTESRLGFSWFEAIIAIAAKEIVGETIVNYNEPISSLLIERHRKLCAEAETDERIRRATVHYSRRVVDVANRIRGELDSYADFGFLECVRRIELLEDDR